jgi:hypothetical protein
VVIRQEDHRHDLERRLNALSSRATEWRDGLRSDQLLWSPPGDGWSIGQVFEHLVTANTAYLPLLDGQVRNALERVQGSAVWKPTVMGNLLVRSLGSPRKLPAPKEWRPAPAPRPAVIEAFLETIATTRALLDASASLPWSRLRFGSPLLRLVRLNLGDGFTVITAHAERHFQQIERVGRASGFPA